MSEESLKKGRKLRLRITKLPPERWEDFKRLRLESLKRDPKAFLSSYEDEAKLGKEVWQSRINNVIFATVNGKPVGMMTFLQRNRKKTEHISDIFAVYVNKDFRGVGIGEKLLKKVITLQKENPKVSKIALSVSSEQTAAINLYLKYKFNVVGVLEKEFKIDGNYYDELVMERLL